MMVLEEAPKEPQITSSLNGKMFWLGWSCIPRRRHNGKSVFTVVAGLERLLPGCQLCSVSHSQPAAANLFGTRDQLEDSFFTDQERGGDRRWASGRNVSEASTCSLAFTSWYVARVLTTRGPVLVHGPGWGRGWGPLL